MFHTDNLKTATFITSTHIKSEKNSSTTHFANTMSFFQRRSKVIVPTPDPPVRRQVPDRGIIEASVLVVPPDGLVRKTGMKYEEFNVESLSEMILMYDKIIGLVQVAECNSSAIIIACQ